MSKEKKTKKITLGNVFAWIFGVLFGINGLYFTFSGHWKAGVPLILASSILIPYINNFIENKSKFELSRGLKITLIVILFIIYAVNYNSDKSLSYDAGLKPTEYIQQENIQPIETQKQEPIKVSKEDEKPKEPAKPQVEIISHNDYVKSSYLHIVGEVKNNGNAEARYVKITAKFYKDGKFIDRDYTYVDDTHIGAGQSNTFELSWEVKDFDEYELLVS